MINQYDEHEWHNGGDMFFGPDSFLYIGVGDEGDLGEPYNNAQKINNGLFSGVLRIDVNQNPSLSHAVRRQPQEGATKTSLPSGWPATYTQGYFIPNDNPWVNPSGTVLEEFYAMGLRNPYRMTFDASSGKALIGDVGQEAAEEIDVLEKGANYQWSYLEGTVAGPKAKPTVVLGKETPPIYSYPHASSGSCVIGGYVYRGSKLPGNLVGKYIFGDFVTGQIWSLDWQTPGAQPVQLFQMPASSLTGFSVDMNNEIYVTTLGASGKVYKISVTGGTAQPPATLSATGAFASLANLTPRSGVVPYNVNSPLWSDGATKQRWIALPNDGAPYTSSEVAKFSATGIWAFPVGTVFIKHFELGTNDTNPAVRKRLETRFLVNGTDGWYGVTYKWRADGTDADLLTSGENMSVSIATVGGGTRAQNWTFPSRGDCMNCHTSNAGYVLGPNTRQLNGSYTYASSGITANQLATWSAIGMFDVTLSSAQIASYNKTVPMTDANASLELKVRSYLDSNCAHCHRPGGVRANMDARFDTPLDQTNIVNGSLFNDLGITNARIVAPNDISRSMMHIRANSLSGIKMPPLAKNVVDTAATTMISQWINSIGTTGGPQPNLAGQDVGVLNPAGSTTGSGTTGSYTLSGSGAGIYDVADAFQYASTTLVGDGEIRARITGQTNTNEWAKAGVMVRETVAAGSRHAVCFLTPLNGTGYEFRAATDQPSEFFYGPASAAAPNNWVKLVRTGDTLSGYASTDGQNWTLINTGTIPGLQSTVNIGLIVTSSNNGTLSTATFDNVLVTGATSTVNRSPVLTQPENQSTARSAVTGLQIQAADPDNNTLTYSASGLPTGLAINTSTGFISGTVSISAAGSYNVTVSASDGTLINSKTFIWAITAPGTSLTFTGSDIGDVGLEGSATTNNGVFTLKGAGADIFFNADAFQFNYGQLSGDGEIRARVVSQTNTNEWAKAGVMIRESLDAGSRHALMMVTPTNGFGMIWRSNTNGVSNFAQGPDLNPTPNNWVRLVRAGNLLTGYSSANGMNWTAVFTVTLSSLSANVYVGLAATATDTSVLSTAVFDNVQITGSSTTTNQAPVITQPADQSTARGAFASLQIQAIDPDNNALTYSASGLPTGLAINTGTGLISGTVSTSAVASYNVTVSASDGTLTNSKTFIWATTAPGTGPTLTGADIGPVTLSGSMAFNSSTGVFTVKSSGSGIFGTADEFQFASTALTGDGEIKARVSSLTNTNSWSKAGVMIREDLTAGARFGLVCVTPSNGFSGNYRTSVGGLRDYAGGPALSTAPNNWVRIVRAGNLITGYTSATGTSWTYLFNTTLPNLASTVRIGLAVSATDNSQLATATFDNVLVTGSSTSANQAPAVTQPADQSTVRGAVSSLQIQASDPDSNVLTYSASGLPTGLAINTSTGLISGTVSTTAVASYNVTVSATDGTLTNSKTFIWATAAPGTSPTLTGTDIGSVGQAGSMAFNSATGVFTVKSSGSGIFGTDDEFQFASTALTGDGEIKARVTSLMNGNSWSKAGVMIREDLTAGARFGLVCVTPTYGLAGNYRTSAGGMRDYAGGPALNAAPNNWVRIVRAGSLITGYTSATGTSWTHLFTATLPNLANTVRIGLAVTATDNSQLATATFDNVLVTSATPASQNAIISLVSMAGTKVQLSGYPTSWNQWLSTYGNTSPNTNLMNYALGQNPRSAMGLTGLHLVNSLDGHYGAQFKHRADISDVTYRIETSTDLSRWTPVNVAPVVVDGSDGTRTDTYSALNALLGSANSTVFIRLRVTHNVSGLSATGDPLSLQRISFAAGSETLGYANINAPVFAGSFADMPIITTRNCYLEVGDGPYAGQRFDIGNDGRVNVASSRNTASVVPNLAVTQVIVRPHVTLDDVLDKTRLISGISSSLADKASFYVGTGYVSYWLYNATPADSSKAVWVSAGDSSLTNAGGRVVTPGEGMFLKSSRDTSMIFGGHVRTNSFVQLLRPGQNLLAQPCPLAGSPAISNFNINNGLISSSQNTSADQLLIWNRDATGGQADFSTVWYAQFATSAYWVSANDASLADYSNAPLFQPHRAIFLKRVSSATTQVTIPVRWRTGP